MRINLKVSILVVTSAILFTACGGESAKDATEKFYNSLKNGDIATYKKYSTDSTQRLMGLTFAMGCFDKDLKQESELSACMKNIFKDINSFKVVDVKEIAKRKYFKFKNEYLSLAKKRMCFLKKIKRRIKKISEK